MIHQLDSTTYGQLRRRARSVLRRYGRTDDISPLALVHEAWVKLSNGRFENSEHMIAVATHAMRQVIIDRARSARALKRGPGWIRVDEDYSLPPTQSHAETRVAVGLSLRRLQRSRPDAAAVAVLRGQEGHTVAETARRLGCSQRHVDNQWRIACNHLTRELDIAW